MNTKFNNVFDELTWRNLLANATPGARDILIREKVTCYVGFDPSAKSLHIGNLLPIMGLVRMQQHGHTPIVILGGGTGMIGDPSGRNSERPLLTNEQISENLTGIRTQLQKFLDFSPSISNPAQIINNSDWLSEIRLLDFLRDVGKHFSVGTMLGKESVRSRMERKEGISFTEFSYQLLQAFDFLNLFENNNCTFQMGGNDQWGNILGGIDLIRRVHGGMNPSRNKKRFLGPVAHGISYPLITTSSGEKFGKSQGGAPTLDPNETSPYKLYQFFMNVSDEDVIPYLKMFTLLDQNELHVYEQAIIDNPKERIAQKKLSEELTRIVHGESGFHEASNITNALFRNDLKQLTPNDLKTSFPTAKNGTLSRARILEGISLSSAVVSHGGGLVISNSELRRLVTQKALRINGAIEIDFSRLVTLEDFIDNKVMVVQRGKKAHDLIWLTT